MAQRLLSAVVLLSLLVSAEFRLAFQSDGKTRFAFWVGVSMVTGRSEEKISLSSLVFHSPAVLSLKEAMYLRNRLEEILDDDEDDGREEGSDFNHEEPNEGLEEMLPSFD